MFGTDTMTPDNATAPSPITQLVDEISIPSLACKLLSKVNDLVAAHRTPGNQQ
jgi:hypothetical protein